MLSVIFGCCDDGICDPTVLFHRFIPSRTSVAFARKALFTQPVKQKEDEDK